MTVDVEMSVSGTVTIAAGENDSTILFKGHHKYITLFLPANWVTSVITFKGCNTKNGTPVAILKGSDGLAIATASVAASKCVVLDGSMLGALKAVSYIQLVSTEAQITDDKIITIALMR